MKIPVPEDLETPFAMLMKGVSEELRADEQFKDTALVYLKIGGISLARQYVETRKKFFGYDPLEIDTGFRFPRLQEVTAEEAVDDDDSEENEEDEIEEKTED